MVHCRLPFQATKMLTTPEHYGEYIMGCARIYRSVLPTMPICTVLAPYEYLKDTEHYVSSRPEFIKRVDAYLLKQTPFADSILFDVEPDGGLRATITHTTEKPVINWPFVSRRNIIELLLEFHVTIGTVPTCVRVPRSDISNINMLGLYDSIGLTLSTKGLTFHLDDKYFEVRRL